MGWGHFSTVWMCRDTASSTPNYVAMKIQKSASHYREAAFDEIELLGCIQTALKNESYRKECGLTKNTSPGVVLLLDHFEHTGPNGKHVCMIFEMLGENLLKVIKNYDYRGISIPVVQNLTKQICQGLDFLHRHCGIIHTDLKPENILIATPPPPPSPLFVKSLIEQQQTTKTIIQKKKKKSKNSKKKKDKQNTHNNTTTNTNNTSATAATAANSSAGGVATIGGNGSGSNANTTHNSSNINNNININNDSKQTSNVDGAGTAELSTEQKKKLKKKMRKKRQKARKSEKNKKGIKGNDENHDLPPVDELHEMTLMEKASEPIAYTSSSNLQLSLENIASDDDADDDNIDDDIDDENDMELNLLKMANSYPRNSLSPNRSQSPEKNYFQNIKLIPLQQFSWLRSTLLSAINIRTIETSTNTTSSSSASASSSLSLKFNESQLNSKVLLPDGLQPSPIHLPGVNSKVSNVSNSIISDISHIESEAVKIISIPQESWIFPTHVQLSNIHIVSYFLNYFI